MPNTVWNRPDERPESADDDRSDDRRPLQGQPVEGQGQAIVAVVRRGERYLIHRRAEGVSMAGYWTPLSGRLELGETQANAVVREVAEEVGLVVRAGRKVWECDTHDRAYRLHWWLVDETDPSAPTILDPVEVAEIRWATVEEFASMSPTFDDDQRFFREILPAVI